MTELYSAWLAAPHKTATLRAVTEHFQAQLPPGAILGKPCRKHGHTWNGTPWCLRKGGHCMICAPSDWAAKRARQAADPSYAERRRERERLLRQRHGHRINARRRQRLQECPELRERKIMRQRQARYQQGALPLDVRRVLMPAIRAAGRYPTVAQLVAAEQRRYWREHPDDRDEWKRQFAKWKYRWRYLVDPLFREQQRKKSRNYRKTNPDKKREQSRRWYAANRERALYLARRWQQLNPRPRKPMTDQAKQRLREWAAANPDRDRLSRKAREHRRNQRCRQARGLLPVRGKDLQSRFDQFNMKCAYCGCSCSPTLDHFIPLSKGGTHALGNLIPACHDCNSRKRDLDPEIWYRSQPFFTEHRWRMILRVLGKQRGPIGQISLV